MSEEVLGQSVESSAPVASAPQVETPTERTLPQSQVNELIGRAKHEAVESYKRQQSQPSSQPQSDYRPQQQNTMPESDYRRIAAEEAQRLRDQWISDAQGKSEQEHAQRVVQNFWDKIAAGKNDYEDFETVTGDISLPAFPNVVQLLADHVDNAHDLLYEFGKDRLKLEQIERLSERSPKDAIVQIKRIAESIKANQAATRMRTPNAPLSQQRPSNTGTDAGGPLGWADLKRKYRG